MPDDRNVESVESSDLRDADRRTQEVLAEILAELRGLPERVSAAVVDRERSRIDAPPLPRLQLAAAMPLLAEISAAVGDAAWSTRELFTHAETDAQLRTAMVAAVGKLDVGATRRLGRLLARCEGVTLPDRFRVERVDADGPADCAVWRVLRV